MQAIRKIQAHLNWTDTGSWNPQFRDSGSGMMGATGFLLGLCGGLHMGVVLTIALVYATNMTVLNETEPPGYLVPLLHWSLYMSLLCGFHFMEFLTTALWQQKDLCYDSFIVNHSAAYTCAALAAWVEYTAEAFWLPRWKHNMPIAAVGLLVVLAGQAVRTVSMWTCGRNFSHKIMYNKSAENPTHQLVTNGIYSVLRHPSYFGWFYWSIGTQVLLCNPVCTCLYAWASWNFFKSRIPVEEQLLHGFYQEEYVTYCRRTVIGIPFIKSPVSQVAASTGASSSVPFLRGETNGGL